MAMRFSREEKLPSASDSVFGAVDKIALPDFRAALENVALPVLMLDLNGLIIFANEFLLAFNGKPKTDFVGRNWVETFELAEKLDDRRRRYAEFVSSGRTRAHINNVLVNHKGERREISWSISTLHDAHGSPIGYLAIGNDITVHREYENSLLRAREYYLTLFEEFPALIWRSGIDGKSDYFNCAWLDFTGRKLSEELGDGWAEGVHPDELQHCLDTYLTAFANREPFEMKYRLRHRDGTYHWILDFGRPFNDPDGKFGGYIGSCYDITESRLAAANLQESEWRLRRITEHMQSLIVQIDLNGVFEYVSLSHEPILGYIPESLVGRKTSDFVHPDDYHAARICFGNAIRGNQPGRLETRFRHANGHYVWLALDGKAIFDDAGCPIGLVLASTEITARKEVERQLSDSLCHLQQILDGTVNALAATTELRDPYTAGHQRKVAALAVAIAQRMGLPPSDIDGIAIAAILHDIGKIRVPAEILTKPGLLNEFEMALVKTHAEMGFEVLKTIAFPWPVAATVRQHHERLNGSGYPDCLCGEQIGLGARILAVADVVEAMSHHRPYRAALGIDQALAEIDDHRGDLYDTDVVDVCLSLFREHGFTFPES